jgi:hypothetical protein
MVRSARFSIAALMGVVLFAAIALAALRRSTEIWAGVLFLATLGALGIALVGAFCRGGSERGGWIGFAVFGWLYMGAAFEPYHLSPTLPTQYLLELLASRIGGIRGPYPAFGMSGMGGGMGGSGGGGGGPRAATFFQIGHCLLTLLAACLGALLGNRLFGAAVDRSDTNTAASPMAGEARPRKRWVAPLLLMLSGAVLLAAIACAGAILPPALWAGSTFVLTWLLIGLISLAALVTRARRREPWLGACLFGAGLMILPICRFAYDPWPQLPTVELLNEIRPWLPAVANGSRGDPDSVTAANGRIHEILKQHVPMHFKEEMPLEDFLDAIRKAIPGPDGKGIPIYVDPIGLQEADKTLWSPLRLDLDLDGIPLRTSLQLCLKQIDLAYSVKDGLVFITSEESHDESLRSASADAFQVVGHCVLALIAAGLGGLAAPFVCNLTRKLGG